MKLTDEQMRLAIKGVLHDLLAHNYGTYFYYTGIDMFKSQEDRARDSYAIVTRECLDIAFSMLHPEEVIKKLDITIHVQSILKDQLTFSNIAMFLDFHKLQHSLESLRHECDKSNFFKKNVSYQRSQYGTPYLYSSAEEYATTKTQTIFKLCPCSGVREAYSAAGVFGTKFALTAQSRPVKGELDKLGHLTLGFTEDYSSGFEGLAIALVLKRLQASVGKLPEGLDIGCTDPVMRDAFDRAVSFLSQYINFDVQI